MLWIGGAFMTGHLPVRTFDSAAWKRAEESDADTRLHMIEHLVWSGKLDGLTQTQVVALLGPRPETDYFSEWDFVYWLGPNRGLLRIDSEWLVIRFNEAGRVAEYRVVSD